MTSEAQTPTVNFTLGDYSTTDLNGVVNAILTVEGTGTDVGAFDLSITYDPALVEPVLTAAGTPDCTNLAAVNTLICGPDFTPAAPPAPPAGTMTVVVVHLTGLTGSVDVASIPFRGLGTAGVSALDIIVEVVSDSASQEITSSTVDNGSITLTGPDPTPTPTPTPVPPTATPTPTPTPVPPTATPTPTPDPAATSTPTPTPTPTPDAAATATPTPDPAATATPTPDPAATATPTPDPAATATPTAAGGTPVPTQTPGAALTYDGPYSAAPETLELDPNASAFDVPVDGLADGGDGEQGAVGGTGGAVGGTGGAVGGTGGAGEASNELASTGASPLAATASIVFLAIGGALMVAARREDRVAR